jgi:hypothetical protein
MRRWRKSKCGANSRLFSSCLCSHRWLRLSRSQRQPWRTMLPTKKTSSRWSVLESTETSKMVKLSEWKSSRNRFGGHLTRNKKNRLQKIKRLENFLDEIKISTLFESVNLSNKIVLKSFQELTYFKGDKNS